MCPGRNSSHPTSRSLTARRQGAGDPQHVGVTSYSAWRGSLEGSDPSLRDRISSRKPPLCWWVLWPVIPVLKVLLLPQRALTEEKKEGGSKHLDLAAGGRCWVPSPPSPPAQGRNCHRSRALRQLHFSFALIALITARQPLFLLLSLPSPRTVEARGVLANKP